MQTLAAALSAYGVYAFIKQKLVASMFIQTHFVYFDYEQSVLSFYFDYFCMMILFTALSYYTSLFIKKRYKMNDSGGQHDF